MNITKQIIEKILNDGWGDAQLDQYAGWITPEGKYIESMGAEHADIAREEFGFENGIQEAVFNGYIRVSYHMTEPGAIIFEFLKTPDAFKRIDDYLEASGATSYFTGVITSISNRRLSMDSVVRHGIEGALRRRGIFEAYEFFREWIGPNGEVVKVDSSHFRVMRDLNLGKLGTYDDATYDSALEAGWIRKGETDVRMYFSVFKLDTQTIDRLQKYLDEHQLNMEPKLAVDIETGCQGAQVTTLRAQDVLKYGLKVALQTNKAPSVSKVADFRSKFGVEDADIDQYVKQAFESLLNDVDEMAKPSPAMTKKEYYHCTQYEDRADKIWSEGIQPDMSLTPEDQISRPIGGRVYMSTSLYETLPYLLGGIYMGSDYPESWVEERGRYGYLFVIPGSELVDIHPDEDQVGKAVYDKFRPLDKYRDILSDKMPIKTGDEFGTNIESLLDQVEDGEYDAWIMAGKILMPHLPDDVKLKIVRKYKNVAHAGMLMPTEMWKFDKYNSNKLESDGSNFFELAVKVDEREPEHTPAKEALDSLVNDVEESIHRCPKCDHMDGGNGATSCSACGLKYVEESLDDEQGEGGWITDRGHFERNEGATHLETLINAGFYDPEDTEPEDLDRYEIYDVAFAEGWIRVGYEGYGHDTKLFFETSKFDDARLGRITNFIREASEVQLRPVVLLSTHNKIAEVSLEDIRKFGAKQAYAKSQRKRYEGVDKVLDSLVNEKQDSTWAGKKFSRRTKKMLVIKPAYASSPEDNTPEYSSPVASVSGYKTV